MLNQAQRKLLEPRSRTVMILAAALIMGIAMAMAVFAAMVDWNKANASMSVLVIVGLAGMAVAIVMSMVLPGLVAQTGLDQTETPKRSEEGDSKKNGDQNISRLCDLYQTKIIFRAGLIEGACFLNAIIFFLEVSIISLGCVGLGVLFLLIFFPSPGRLEEFVEGNL